MKKNIVLSVKITPEQREKIKEMKDVHCLNVCAMVRNFIDEQYLKVTLVSNRGGAAKNGKENT